jgi:hypothetical protein
MNVKSVHFFGSYYVGTSQCTVQKSQDLTWSIPLQIRQEIHFFPYLTDNCRPDAPLSFYYTF